MPTTRSVGSSEGTRLDGMRPDVTPGSPTAWPPINSAAAAPRYLARCGSRCPDRGGPARRRGATASTAAARPVGTSRRQVGGHARRPQQQLRDLATRRRGKSITGWLASAPNRSGRMRHLGTSGYAVLMRERPLARNASPTGQSSSTGSVDPTILQRAVRGCAAASPRSSAAARSSSVATSRIWVALRGIAASGARVAPGRCSARRRRIRRCRPACSARRRRRRPHCTVTSPASKRPAAGDHQQRSTLSRSGRRYRMSASRRGLGVAASCPRAWWPGRGVVKTARARDPLTPAAAWCRLRCGLGREYKSAESVSAEVAGPGLFHHGVSRDVGGIPLGPKPCDVPAPGPGPAVRRSGRACPRSGSPRPSRRRPDRTSCRSALRVGRPVAGYWSVMANVSDRTSNITSTHAAIASGDCVRCQRRCGASAAHPVR